MGTRLLLKNNIKKQNHFNNLNSKPAFTQIDKINKSLPLNN